MLSAISKSFKFLMEALLIVIIFSGFFAIIGVHLNFGNNTREILY
jgi:hypothetical protein